VRGSDSGEVRNAGGVGEDGLGDVTDAQVVPPGVAAEQLEGSVGVDSVEVRDSPLGPWPAATPPPVVGKRLPPCSD